MRCFVIPDGVHIQSEPDGRLVVLNGNTGTWHTLNRTGADLYQELSQSPDLDSVFEQLARRYHKIPQDRIRADVDRLVANLVRRGLLEPSESYTRHPAAVLMSTPTKPGGVPYHHRVLAAVAFAMALVLLRLPFRMSTNVVSVLKRKMTYRDATTPEALHHLVTARLVTGNYPGRVACLELSLTAVIAATLLRRRIDWCFGFAPDPQRFHAWIEVDGTPVTERTDDPILGTYRRMIRV